MATNKALRAKARQSLGGGIFQTTWLLMLVVFLIISVVESAISFTGIGLLILAGPLEYGVARILVSTSRGNKDIDFTSLIAGFKEDAGNTILLGILKSVFVALWSLLFVIPGIIKSYSYSMSAFIQQDAENKDWRECLNKSRAMMNGKKWKLFCLDLSFIGWYILGSLCFGIGVLFVIPYNQQARAEFYEELKKENA